MKHATQVQLIERVLEYAKQRTTDMAPTSSRQQTSIYLSSERLEQERQNIFYKYPQILAHCSELAKPGDYLCHDDTGQPVLLVRDEQGSARAFLNVCRHRGTRVVMESCGSNKKKFACPYHSWTYDQCGKLIHIPHKEGFPEIEYGQLNLIALPTVEKWGFIWVSLDPEATIDLDGYLGPLAEDLESYGFDKHFTYQPKTFQKAINWKIGIEIFLEGYHVQHAHRNTIAPFFFDNIGIYDRFSLHLRNLFPKRKMVELLDKEKSQWEIRANANVLYYLFPNCLILIEPDHASFFTIYPDAVDRVRVKNVTLLPSLPETEKAVKYWQKNIDILDNATAEDFVMGESIQRNLSSGANSQFQFGRYEQSLRYFEEIVESALKS